MATTYNNDTIIYKISSVSLESID